MPRTFLKEQPADNVPMPSRILSINGNKSMNFLVKEVLSQKWNVSTVTNVTEGIQQIKKQRDVELLIVDVDHHTDENLSFVNYITSSSLFGKKVIVLGGKEAFTSGENICFMPKPFNPIKLVDAAKKLLAVNATSTPIFNN